MRAKFLQPSHRSPKRRDVTNWARIGETYVSRTVKRWSDFEYLHYTRDLYTVWLPFALFWICVIVVGHALIH